jgi:hypothetical protein
VNHLAPKRLLPEMETVHYAKALIALYGEHAAEFAQERANKFRDDGDIAEELVWRNITEAIKYLVADEAT